MCWGFLSCFNDLQGQSLLALAPLAGDRGLFMEDDFRRSCLPSAPGKGSVSSLCGEVG